MHFTCRSFIGQANSQTWSTFWENEPDDQLKFSKGHLFGLIQIQSSDSPDFNIIGHDIVFEINQSYFSADSSGNILSDLKNTLSLISQNPLYSDFQLKITLIIILNSEVFIASLGPSQIILNRASQISRILSGKENQITTISGPIKTNDRLLFTTQDFFEKITWDKIKTVLIDPNIKNIEENFLSLLYSFEDQSSLSSAFIEVNPDEDIISPAPPIIQDEPSPISSFSPSPTKLQKQPSVFVNDSPGFKISHHQKPRIIIAILLIIGLCISCYFGYRKNQITQSETKFKSLQTELEKKLNNISVVKSLNIETANKIAKESQDIINQMNKLNIHQTEISQFKTQVDNILAQTGDSDNFTPDFVYDTSLITNQPHFSKLIYSKDNLYLLDPSSGRLDSVNPVSKSTKNILISDQVKNSNKILVDQNNFYLASANSLNLIEKSSLTPKIDFSKLSSSLSITDLQFWNGSLYVLDNQNQKIWKFTPNSSGFGEPVSWLKNDLKTNLGSNSISIDGKVWVLSESGQITPYLSGVKDNFKPNQSTSFSKSTLLNTDSDSDFLVFADDSKFVYVYQKTGELKSKYNLSKFKIVDLAFDSSKKIIYFIASDQKIYKITL
jgi:hypothetical protein